MPYIAIRSWPKDEETVNRVVERINQVFLEEWGCPPQALTISHEEIAPEDWAEKVVKPIIEPNLDKMKILSGEKKY
ncbi:MAG: hypothetical protein IJF34_12675 [Clostridia bacterium]|nr:hypothetical protein [Oscillospiraceae bacterium]MBQ2750629.1 hypothetical protein [Clostridia bacterium]